MIEEAKARNLIIDEAIQSIFDISSKIEIDFDIQQRALLRAQIGNPPRKRQNGIGDSLNWEAIISGCGASPLCIISSDGDYFSELHENEPKAFLRKEWADTSEGNELIAYKTISSFLSDYGKGIEAGDEHSAEYLVSELEASNSFKRTHELVEALRSAKGLEPKHVERIINAAHYNNQISLIVGDDDIQSFLTDLYEGFAGSIDARFGEMLYEQLGGGWL